MSIEIRSIEASEVAAFRGCMASAFGVEPNRADDADTSLRSFFDLARSYAAFDGGRIVATSGSFSLDMAVPGNRTIPVAGLTMVGVLPSHRRRGVLSAMMRAHFDDVDRTGESISALWASEAVIYGRFGYGHAAPARRFTLDTARARTELSRPCDQLELADVDEARRRLPAVFDRARSLRPGTFARRHGWWDVRHFRDQRREPDAPRRRYLIARRGTDDVGFAAYRQRLEWDDNGRPNGTLDLIELVAVDGAAEASLWHHLLSFDLYKQVKWWNAPSDSVLPHILRDPRELKVDVIEGIWLRLCDVPTALAARGYGADGSVSFRVHHRGDSASYRLDVADGQATCAPCAAASEPELELELPVLSALYFGAVAPQTLANAGRIRGSRNAVERAGRLLANPGLAAWCPEIF